MGRLVAALPGHAVILVTHPGRFATGVPATLAISGLGEAARSAPASEASLLDVAPSVLALLGVPLSRELPGQPRTDLLPPFFAERHPPRWVETYGERGNTHTGGAPASPALDDEMRERLRSLGYVQ